MRTEPGLRERKLRQARRQISDTALALFTERGFERTSAEVARMAGVSEATVSNYFWTKEDLIYDRMSGYEDSLVAAPRERPPGQPLLTEQTAAARTEEQVDRAVTLLGAGLADYPSDTP
jgi:AcrR family transcriptional regulator